MLMTFFLLEITDIVMTSVGLHIGRYYHYNPIAVWLYENSSLFLFFLFRLMAFYVIYKVITSNFMQKVRFPLVGIAIYIYICAVLWNLHLFDIIDLYVEPMYSIARIHIIPLEFVSRTVGVL